jgi:glycosyltransferase involved in cell wall biosynthesis
MKILYDISVLGLALYSQETRTGISRVIENVAAHMVKGTDYELEFCAYHSLVQLIQSDKYIATMPELQKIPLNFSSANALNTLLRLLLPIYPGPSRKLIYRAIRRIFFILLHNTNSRHGSIEPEILRSADIFHATYYPIPEFVRRYPNLKNFITLYDLIPILYPQFFSSKKDQLLHDSMKSITSITPNDWVIAISQTTKNDLCNYLKFDPSRVFVTHLAASDLFYQCYDHEFIARTRTKYGIPGGQYVLSLSTLEPRKNIVHTIRCFAAMVREQNISDLNLVLVGTKGWNFDRIFRELSNHDSLQGRIILTGYVADEDLAALYSGALMFVYPSFYEGFGLPPLEAMQCGVPVITSNTSSLPEVVGEAGMMVDPEDADALCQSMYDIYRNSSLRNEMSRKSLERAKQFSWEKCAQETVRAYKTAMRNST